MNNVHSLPMDLLTDFFFHGNSLGIYQENISVGKIPRKFIDGKILSILPFVFIDSLVVISQKYQILNSSNKLIICFNQNKSSSKI
jgi:hypothetical protein